MPTLGGQCGQACERVSDVPWNGYSERLLAGELFEPSRDEVARGILTRMDAAKLERLAVEQGMIPQRERVRREVAAGRTTPEEALRVLGSRALEG